MFLAEENGKAILEQLLMKKNILITLFFIFVLAFILRVLYLPKLALTFGYDQARDAFIVQEILSGDIKILGPPASTPGLYHGVFYYYFLTPAYLIGQGDPIIAAYWTAFFNALTVFVIFYLTYLLTKKSFPALLAAFLFAVSFEATQYAVWLSNPTIGVWTVPLIYLGLWTWVKGEGKWGPILTAIGLGLSIQAEIFLAYHIVPIILWLWVARKQIVKGQFVKFASVLVLILSSMILVEIKFGFRGISGLANLLTTSDAVVKGRDIGDFIILYLNQIGRTFSNSLFPSNAGYGGVLGIGLIYLAIKRWTAAKKRQTLSWQPFLVTYTLAHLTVVSVGGISTPFLTVGIGSGIVILAAIVLTGIWKEKKNVAFILLLVIVLSNLSTILIENKKGQTIFSIQGDMLLSKQLPIIDYTYKEAEGKPFSINTLTSPLWVNTTWSYLYNWHGKNTYGYLPEWHGRDQVGRPGDNLPLTAEDTKLYFLILEPMQGIPVRYLSETVGQEDFYSEIVEEKKLGEITVQKRIRKE